jgi:hypothetical protein
LVNGNSMLSANGKYVQCNPERQNVLSSVSESVSTWESFQFVFQSPDKINIVCFNGKYVTVDPANRNLIRGNADNAEVYETFEIECKQSLNK